MIARNLDDAGAHAGEVLRRHLADARRRARDNDDFALHVFVHGAQGYFRERLILFQRDQPFLTQGCQYLRKQFVQLLLFLHTEIRQRVAVHFLPPPQPLECGIELTAPCHFPCRTKPDISNNVGPVKSFLSTLRRSLR